MIQRKAGFTLIELVVAVGIVGLLLAGIGTFLNGTLRFSSNSIGNADRLRELNDVSGYVVDNLRRASDIDIGTCTPSGYAGSLECAAVVVPESRNGVPIDAYARLTYVRVPRDAFVAAEPGVLPTDPWMNANTDVLVEYRVDACTPPSTCSPPYAATLSLSGMSGPYVVLDGLSSDLPSVFASTTTGVSFSVQERGQNTRVPSSGPLVFETAPRNQ